MYSLYIRFPVGQIVMCVMFKVIIFSNLHKLVLLNQSYPYIEEEYIALSVESCAIFIEILSMVQLIACNGIGPDWKIVNHLRILILQDVLLYLYPRNCGNPVLEKISHFQINIIKVLY